MKNLENVLGTKLNEEVKDDCAAVDTFSKPNKEIMDEIKKEEEAREREEKKNAAKNQLQTDSYDQEKQAIELRYKRGEAKASEARLKARTEENNKYNAGGIDTEDHQKNIDKIEEDYRLALSKVESERSKALSNLRAKNPSGYRRSRDW